MSVAEFGLRGVSAGPRTRPWLFEVDLPVRPGRVTAVVGGDGAGKTTALRVLVGRLAPTGGSVRRPPPERLAGMFAAGGVHGDLTVAENVAFTAAAYGLGPAERRQREDELLGRVGLDGARDRLGSELSGGMRQKLGIVLGLLVAPQLLVLDEPTTGVDPVSRADAWRLLAGAAADGVAVVLSTTYLDEAERAGDIVLLHEGRVLAHGGLPALVAGLPGRLGVAASRPVGDHSWLHGGRWRVWIPEGDLPAGAEPVTPTLEDVAVVAQLAAGDDATGAAA